MNRLPNAKRAAILAMLVDGTSMRSIARLAEVSINTVAKLLNDVGEAAKACHDERVRGIAGRRRIECSQTWAFSYAITGEAMPRESRNTWTFAAIEADSKLIVSYLVADKSRQTTAVLLGDVRSRLTENPELSANDLSGYRGSRAQAAGAGQTGPSDVAPSIPANSEKRRLEKHVAMINLYALHYNYCRVHPALEATPAMEAGLDEVVREPGWIVDLVDARAAKPNRPKRYRKRTGNSN
ncbi:MAG: hypothetical protein F4089_03095 [Gammaproteobacteria bacterium]|nr:hypothetical protein [Gammaproteobacteria bacterium]